MANTKLLPGGSNIIHAPLVDKDGNITLIWKQWWAAAIPRIQQALDKFDTFEGIIGLAAVVEGRPGTVADALTHVDPVGVVLSPGLVPATDVAAGAVQLPTGALSNTLGSAALQNATDFDPSGAAATAQSNAEAFATASDGAVLTSANAHSDAGDAATLTASKAYTDGKFPGVTAHTIPLAKITLAGADGSITVDANGVVTGYVDPT